MNKLILILSFWLLAFGVQGQSNFFWSHTYVESGNVPCTEGYGLLYNWYVVSDARKISSSDDWIVPSYNPHMQTLANNLGALGNYSTNTVGGKLKETGTTYWDDPNVGATNEVSFNGRGAGYRSYNVGDFSNFTFYLWFWTSTTGAGTSAYGWLRSSNTVFNITQGVNVKNGNSIRLLYTGAGTPTTYTGNDGKIYDVVVIDTQRWINMNLRETRFRNGDIIPFHGADNDSTFTNAEWVALTTAGVCAYGNDVANVGCNFTFPTE